MKQILPLLLFPLFFFASPIQAADSITITAIPPRLETEALPGSTLQKTLKLTNSSVGRGVSQNLAPAA